MLWWMMECLLASQFQLWDVSAFRLPACLPATTTKPCIIHSIDTYIVDLPCLLLLSDGRRHEDVRRYWVYGAWMVLCSIRCSSYECGRPVEAEIYGFTFLLFHCHLVTFTSFTLPFTGCNCSYRISGQRYQSRLMEHTEASSSRHQERTT